MLKKFMHTFRHWVLPHETNNFRAKLLHNTGYFALIGVFLAFNVFLRILDSTGLHILGFTSSITIDEVVRLTNQERLSQGLQPLKYNELLADAARRKAANMLEENYWSHNSPSGKTPWIWFNAAGYKYSNAGENLAKDFGSTERLVSAWMASPTHKANIVSDKFQEIGVAVVPGTLLGTDTVLVVQLFGSTVGGSVPADTPQVAAIQASPKPETKGAVNETNSKTVPVSTAKPSLAPSPVPESLNEETPAILELKEFSSPVPSLAPSNKMANSIYNEFNLKKILSLVTTGLLILILLLDVAVAESKKLSRRVGKNWAHILFINVILILVTIVNSGSLLP